MFILLQILASLSAILYFFSTLAVPWQGFGFTYIYICGAIPKEKSPTKLYRRVYKTKGYCVSVEKVGVLPANCEG